MHIRRRFTVIVGTVGLTAVAAAAAAQSSAGPQISHRDGYFTFGGTIGGVVAETPGGIPDLAAHVEVPLAAAWSVRGQVGRQREIAPVDRTTDALTLRRYTASLVFFNPRWDRGSNYAFVGVGAYQFRYATSDAADKTLIGLHYGIGAESPAIGPVVLNIEVTLRRDLHPQRVSPLTLALGFKVRY